MDERLAKALEFSNFLETQNNQKRIFLAQYKENLIHYTRGHKFTVTQELINFCNTLSSINQINPVLLDDNNIPFIVTNISEFTKELLDVYIIASSKYAADYETVKQNRSVRGFVDL
jgi:hypothetical protein